jgi:hypothetical protein
MVRQIVQPYDRLVAPVAPATGEAADLLTSPFDRRWPVRHLRELLDG